MQEWNASHIRVKINIVTFTFKKTHAQKDICLNEKNYLNLLEFLHKA
jgi:hypothetical protein